MGLTHQRGRKKTNAHMGLKAYKRYDEIKPNVDILLGQAQMLGHKYWA